MVNAEMRAGEIGGRFGTPRVPKRWAGAQAPDGRQAARRGGGSLGARPEVLVLRATGRRRHMLSTIALDPVFQAKPSRSTRAWTIVGATGIALAAVYIL